MPDSPKARVERRPLWYQVHYSRAAQDAKHVVLLDGDPVCLDDLCEAALHHGCRAEDAHDDLLGRRSERLGLLDLVL